MCSVLLIVAFPGYIHFLENTPLASNVRIGTKHMAGLNLNIINISDKISVR